MKKVIYILCFLSITSNMLSQPWEGILTRFVSLGANARLREELNYYVSHADYTNGGVTINYPANYFEAGSIPVVHTAVQLNGLPYSADLDVQPVITSNSDSSVTIRVNKSTNGGTPVEAATDDVTVMVFAVGLPGTMLLPSTS